MIRGIAYILALCLALTGLCGCAGYTTVHREDQLAIITRPTAGASAPPASDPVPTTLPAQTQSPNASAPEPPATETEPAEGSEPTRDTGDHREPAKTEPQELPPETQSPETQPIQTEPAVLTAADIARVINDLRLDAGLPPLTLREPEAAAARTRAAEIAADFRHTRPDGSDWTTALTEAGWSGSRSAESLLKASPGFSPEELVDMWMLTAGHRENILDPGFTALGVGLQGGSVIYCVAIFTE